MNHPNPDPIAVQVRRVFAAPRERVFRAWLDRDALQHWFRPGGLPLVVSRLDAQVGGGFRFETTATDGSAVITTGTYLEISSPEKLVFTWISSMDSQQESLVTLEFIEQGATTEVILTHDRVADSARISIYHEGWTALFEQLASFL